MQKLERQLKDATKLANATPQISDETKASHQKNLDRLNRSFSRAITI